MNKCLLLTEPVPSILEMEKSISVRLVNHHRSTTRPRPSMPGLINVAGTHIKAPKPLPHDIKVRILFFIHFIELDDDDDDVIELDQLYNFYTTEIFGFCIRYRGNILQHGFVHSKYRYAEGKAPCIC